MLEQPDEELINRILDVAYGHNSDPDISMIIVEKHNILNITCHGTININGTTYEFLIDDGNWNGTEIRKWGTDAIEYHPPKTEPSTFAPTGNLDFDSLRKYVALRQTDKFRSMESGFNYDRYFNGNLQPYYKWAAMMGLAIVPMGHWGQLEELYSADELAAARAACCLE